MLKRYSHFPWGEPGPSSPTLKTGSPKSAGMDPRPLNDIDGAIERAIAERVIPGAVTLIARKGTVVKHDAYGYAAQYEDDSFAENGRSAPDERRYDL